MVFPIPARYFGQIPDPENTLMNQMAVCKIGTRNEGTGIGYWRISIFCLYGLSLIFFYNNITNFLIKIELNFIGNTQILQS